jgi:signal transduction histidine kinase
MSSGVGILLVDDEARNLDALEAVLAHPDYLLLRAQDADTALKLLLAHEVAAIVLDIKMPEVSGFELAGMIKNTKRFRETPIVFLTAYMLDDKDIVAGYGAGGVDYLTKPVNPEILRHKVAVFADLYRKSRELAKVNAELAELAERLEERVKERTEELEKSEAALRTSADQKDVFLAVLAHELRNPLAPLRTGLDLLRRLQTHDSEPSVRRTLASMDRQVDHLVRLIDDLLDVSRISRGSFDLKRANVDLSTIVHSTVEAVRASFDKRRQKLSTEVEERIFANADQTRFAQIVTNLLHNATKFTPEGGSIAVQLTKEGDTALLRVVDSGIGLRSDQFEQIFQLFARVQRAGKMAEPGLGIGLALARRLAEMHGGSLDVHSEGEGSGTTFSFRMPTEPPMDEPESAAKSSAPCKVATPLGIVVVEDNEDVAGVLADWLADLGHSVTVARTGISGVEAVRASCPDLVICDLGLPELDGFDVCRRVRLLGGEKQPAMVALTGWGREDDLHASKEAGFDFHLVKPVAPEALDGLLRKVGDANSGRRS